MNQDNKYTKSKKPETAQSSSWLWVVDSRRKGETLKDGWKKPWKKNKKGSSKLRLFKNVSTFLFPFA